MNCSKCTEQVCQIRQKDYLPDCCPMLDTDCINAGVNEYKNEDIAKFYADSLKSMGKSFGKMPRVIEAAYFCKLRGYKKIGVAYCSGMLKFGKAVCEILESYGFEVVSCGCKTGGFGPEELVSKDLLGDFGKPRPTPNLQDIPEKFRKPRAICNPIGQAMLLNKAGTQFNVIAGLCVGHDSLFMKYSDAMCTTVVMKDRLFPEQCAPSIDEARKYGEISDFE